METQLLHQKFNDLQNKNEPRSYDSDEIITQLKRIGLEILNSQLDTLNRQHVFVWIWCQWQKALENIQWLYESNHLRDVLFGIANMPASTSEIAQSKVINIDSNEFKKTVGKFL